MDTKKLLIITWIFLAFLIGAGVGYVVGLKGFGQRQAGPPAGQAGPAQQQPIQPNQQNVPSGPNQNQPLR